MDKNSLMKAVKVANNKVEVCSVPEPKGEGVLIKVKSVTRPLI